MNAVPLPASLLFRPAVIHPRKEGWLILLEGERADSMVNQTIETVIDRLYEFVRINKATTVKATASALALSEQQVEKLAHLLEDAGLVTVNYTLSEIQVLMPSGEKPATAGQKAGGKPASKSAEEKIHDDTARLEREVMKSQSVLEFVLSDLYLRMHRVELMLVEIEGEAESSPGQASYLQSELATIYRQHAQFKEHVSAMAKAGTDFEKRMNAFEAALSAIATKNAKPGGGSTGGFFGFFAKKPANPDAPSSSGKNTVKSKGELGQ